MSNAVTTLPAAVQSIESLNSNNQLHNTSESNENVSNNSLNTNSKRVTNPIQISAIQYFQNVNSNTSTNTNNSSTPVNQSPQSSVASCSPSTATHIVNGMASMGVNCAGSVTLAAATAGPLTPSSSSSSSTSTIQYHAQPASTITITPSMIQQQQLHLFNPNYKDTRWLTLEVCREHQRNKCNRNEQECKFAHPPAHVEVTNGKVIACYDSLKVPFKSLFQYLFIDLCNKICSDKNSFLFK